MERQKLGYPLRVFTIGNLATISIVEKARDAFREWGIGPNDWYVCVHMREPSYIGADADRGQNNRNAIPNYGEASQAYYEPRRWVLKLVPSITTVTGNGTSSGLCSEPSRSLDIYLIRHAKFFIVQHLGWSMSQ
jgi:hypothetical protein